MGNSQHECALIFICGARVRVFQRRLGICEGFDLWWTERMTHHLYSTQQMELRLIQIHRIRPHSPTLATERNLYQLYKKILESKKKKVYEGL